MGGLVLRAVMLGEEAGRRLGGIARAKGAAKERV